MNRSFYPTKASALSAWSVLFSVFCLSLGAQPAASPQWHYVQIDDAKGRFGDVGQPAWLRYFGLDMGRINADDHLDVLSGRYVYLNPGDDMTGDWERIELPHHADGILILDVDGDPYADVIAQALPDVYWLEATNAEGSAWSQRIIGSIPATSHVNSQGFERGQIIPGGREEFVIAGDGDIYLFQIPNEPETQDWPVHRVARNTSDEGIGLGDINGDGRLDLAAGRRPEGGEEPLVLVWFAQPDDPTGDWPNAEVGRTSHPIDRVEVADVSGDGRSDVIVSEERYPGLEPDANLFWFEQGEEPAVTWQRHHVVTQFSMNNLDVADLDEDGDLDILTNEHKGPDLELQWWANDGAGVFTKYLIDTGKENHLGTQLADLDGDGDLDIVGAGWDQAEFMHLWRNDFVDDRFHWKHLSTTTGDLPAMNGGDQQTASLVTDLNNDGVNDILITERTAAPAVIGLIYTPDGWERIVIEDEPLRIEAGSAAHDIDGDGDTDVVFGGEARSNEVWWWENPYPDLAPSQGWNRHLIKSSGGTKHHDQAFIDLDGDDEPEMVFWNQGDRTLYFADIPEDPKAGPWDLHPIYTYTDDGEMEPRSAYPGWRRTHEHEGLYPADMDDDGVDEIVGGGRWFDYEDGIFHEHIIDASYTFTRSAAGQLIEGGRPEVVMVVGDGVGPLVLYEWQEGFWQSRTLIDSVDNGHTLDILDFNGDGHLDIFNAEMRFGEGNPDSEVRILLGDGQGRFSKHVVARGFAVHEGRLADLDGDGDLDVLGKPYTTGAPRLDIWLQE